MAATEERLLVMLRDSAVIRVLSRFDYAVVVEGAVHGNSPRRRGADHPAECHSLERTASRSAITCCGQGADPRRPGPDPLLVQGRPRLRAPPLDALVAIGEILIVERQAILRLLDGIQRIASINHPVQQHRHRQQRQPPDRSVRLADPGHLAPRPTRGPSTPPPGDCLLACANI